MSVKIPILDFKLIRAERINDAVDIKIRIKLNGKYFTGVLEMSE